MKSSLILGVIALLSTAVIAAPQSPRLENSVKKRWLWGNRNSDGYSWNHENHDSYDVGNNYDGKDDLISVSETTSTSMEKKKGNSKHHKTTLTMASPITGTSLPSLNSSSCSQSTSTVTIFLNNTITVTQSKTRSHPSRYSSGFPSSSPIVSPIYSNSTSITIPLNTVYSSGAPSSSPIISPIYTNSSSGSIPLSTNYSSSVTNSSVLTSALYTNTTIITIPLSTAYSSSLSGSMITVSPFYINSTSATSTVSTETHTHHRRPPHTDTSSAIFISASTSLPPSASITTSPLLVPTTTLTPTTTLSGSTVPTGTPLPHALLCNVHGYPVGDFFLGQLVESSAGVEVSLYSCYRFCAGIFGIDMGCQSFDFYFEPGTGAPRCDLYSGSVAQSLDMIIPEVRNTWYDVGCAVPMS